MVLENRLMNFNLLHRRGYFTYHRLNIKTFLMMLTLHVCVVYEFQKNTANFPHAALTEWFCITEVESVYCAVRAECYVKRTHFVFKVLKVKVISLLKRHEKKYGGGKVPSPLRCVCKIANATVGFIVSVRLSIRLSIRPHGTFRLPQEGFSWNLIFQYFSKICQLSLKYERSNEYFTWKPIYIYIFLIISR